MSRVKPLQSVPLPPTSVADMSVRPLAGFQRIASMIAKHKPATKELAAEALCTNEAIAVTYTLSFYEGDRGVMLDIPCSAS